MLYDTKSYAGASLIVWEFRELRVIDFIVPT